MPTLDCRSDGSGLMGEVDSLQTLTSDGSVDIVVGEVLIGSIPIFFPKLDTMLHI